MTIPARRILAILLLLGLSARPGLGQGRPPEESAEPAVEPLLSAAAICRRGEHLLENGSDEALLAAERLFASGARLHPGASCARAGESLCAGAIHQRRLREEDRLVDVALSQAAEAVAIDPGSALAHAALANASLVNLEPDRALASARRALELDPSCILARLAEGSALLLLDDLSGARRSADEALASRADLPAAHVLGGNVALLEGRADRAIDSYWIALSLSPGLLSAQLQIAVAYELQGDYARAGAIFRRLLKERPEAVARVNFYMALSLIKRNSPRAALGALEKVAFRTRKGLSDGTVLFYRGISHEMLGHCDQAVAAFREVISAWPEATRPAPSMQKVAVPAYEGLGRCLLRLHRSEEAVEALEEGAARPDATLELLRDLARLYEDYRLPERAIALLERAVSRPVVPREAGDHLGAYLDWARAARRSGDPAALARVADSLARRADGFASLHDVVRDLEMARIFSIAGRGAESLACLRRTLDAGYDQLGWIDGDEEMAALRADPGFGGLRKPAPASRAPGDTPE